MPQTHSSQYKNRQVREFLKRSLTFTIGHNQRTWRFWSQFALFGLLIACLTGCAAIVSGVTNKLADDLSSAILGSPDAGVVSDGLPAYLLLIDALVEGSPDDPAILNTAALLNGSYATAFVADEARQKYFATKAKELALRASCHHRRDFCSVLDMDYDDFVSLVDDVSIKDIEYVYVLASNWAGWIQSHADDFRAVAELARAKALMTRVIELDANHADGSPFIYMGVFATFLPAALGGEPEVGRQNFQRAIEISEGKNLYARVMMAEMYARAMFDRELHDRLLHEVIDADPEAGELTLQNVIAQDLAKQLLESADEFF